jgi:hypothetical protein
MAIITTDVVTEWGAFYLKSQQNMTRLVNKLRLASETESAGQIIFTDETVYQASEATLTDVLQPWQKGFTPKGDLAFKPVAIPMMKIKADISMYPDEVEGNWLSFLASDTATDRKFWPVIRYFLEQQLIPKMEEEWEEDVVYKGVYVAPTTGVPGFGSASINGLKKIINDWITAGRITPIASGAPNTNPSIWVKQVNDFVKSINPAYKGKKMELNMSYDLFERFVDGMRELYGNNTDFSGIDKMGLMIKDNAYISVKPRNSMIGSDKIWMTPKENLKVLKKKTMGPENVLVESQKREVNIMIDFWRGIGFQIPEIVFTNDRDLV